MDISLKNVMTYKQFNNLVKQQASCIYYFILEYNIDLQGSVDFTIGEGELYGIERHFNKYDIIDINYLILCCIDKINSNPKEFILKRFLQRIFGMGQKIYVVNNFDNSSDYISYMKVFNDMQRIFTYSKRLVCDLDFMKDYI